MRTFASLEDAIRRLLNTIYTRDPNKANAATNMHTPSNWMEMIYLCQKVLDYRKGSLPWLTDEEKERLWDEVEGFLSRCYPRITGAANVRITAYGMRGLIPPADAIYTDVDGGYVEDTSMYNPQLAYASQNRHILSCVSGMHAIQRRERDHDERMARERVERERMALEQRVQWERMAQMRPPSDTLGTVHHPIVIDDDGYDVMGTRMNPFAVQ